MIQDILAIYQRKARNEIIYSIARNNKTLVVKSPTGSGKTVILLATIDKYINDGGEACFVWLCPGAGDLEEQSRKSMEEKCPNLDTRGLSDVLSSGFETNATYFINWETIIKKGNIALKEAERRNLFKRIASAHRDGIKFILIIDEEQQNDTSKAQDVIDSFAAIKEIRMSATAKYRPTCEFYEIEEQDVIDAGFISKAIVINEKLKEYKVTDSTEANLLIDLALTKREEIAKEYDRLLDEGKLVEKINPLIVIQFPSNSDDLIERVEEYLGEKGITYDNLLSKWMAEDKRNLEFDPDWKITDSWGFPIVLLMKQAISTGWDCPRAKILVKLRTNMDEDFEIQTIGRIRRMPERKHYGIDCLDYCYLYTLDTKYVESVRQSTSNLYEIQECHLKEDCKTFSLIKELKHSDAGEVDIRVAFKAIHDYFVRKYSLEKNAAKNIKILEDNGFNVADQIVKKIKTGSFATFDDLREDDPLKETEFFFDVDTGRHGLNLMNSAAHISAACGMKSDAGIKILRRLFKKKEGFLNKLLSLPTKEFYAFVINNEDLLKNDFREAANELTKQLLLHLDPKAETFKIPETEKMKYDPTERANRQMKKNVYTEYTQQMLAGNLRSKTERLFEKYCESDTVKWIYKNGDAGLQYFSITYIDNFGKEWLFYPDYIVKMKDGTTWIFEAKGGENREGQSNNIDKKVLNKFESFKQYADRHHEIKWGFVRALNDDLYVSNTEWKEDMSDENVWKPIYEFF